MTRNRFLTTKEAKRYLVQGFTLEKEKNRLQERIEAIRAILESSQSIVLSSGGSKVTDSLGDQVAKMVDLQKDYRETLIEKIELEKSIKGIVYSLEDDRHRGVLMERYINLLTWEEVAVKCGYSWSQTHYLHGEALETLTIKKIG